MGWETVGVEPDVQPGVSGCVLPARDGSNYIGLDVVGELSKGVGQELKGNLEKDSTYVLSLYLAYSDTYQAVQQTKKGFKTVNCDKPASLGIIGLNRQEGLAELMAVATPATDKTWQKHIVYFRPVKVGYNEIGFVALPEEDAPRDWNGNLLMDKVSAIIQIPKAVADSLGVLPGIVLNISKSDPNTINLQNPSFDISYFGSPVAWGIYIIDNERTRATSGFDRSTGNGIRLPLNYGVSDLNVKPSDGTNFASLIANEAGIFAGFSQTMIGGSLQAGTTYVWSVDLAFAKKYREVLPDGYRGVHYKNPLRLRVWGGTATNLRQELLAQTGAVTHHQWKRYDFTLAPEEGNYNSIFLEATYISDVGQPYNGNLLLDNCSAIVKTKDSK
ncbi:MAG TPA: hypothetical protein PK228_07165 [Saprospiraceae bacterium]|nr:hypothetical protein [Saprospiraceae bacterium]